MVGKFNGLYFYLQGKAFIIIVSFVTTVWWWWGGGFFCYMGG